MGGVVSAVYYNLTQDDPFGPFNASDPDSLNDAFQRLARPTRRVLGAQCYIC